MGPSPTSKYKLRATHYPSQPKASDDEFGIAPHTDTSFLTLLAPNASSTRGSGKSNCAFARYPISSFPHKRSPRGVHDGFLMLSREEIRGLARAAIF